MSGVRRSVHALARCPGLGDSMRPGRDAACQTPGRTHARRRVGRPALAVPVDDQRVQRGGAARRSAAPRRAPRPAAQHPGAHRARQVGRLRARPDVRQQRRRRAGGGRARSAQRVERVEVVAQQRRRCGPAPRRRRRCSTSSSSGQHLGAQPHPREGRVGVVRVVPGGRGPSAAQAAAVVARRTPSNGRRQRPSAGRPCRRSSAARSRGPARAAPSRPGRRGCGRAGRGAPSAAAAASSAA